MKNLIATLTLLALPFPAYAAETWTLDPVHSEVGFHVRHMAGKVHGKFDKLTGTLDLDDKDVTKSRVAVEIDAASIDTGVADRDKHLRSPDFLDAEHAPAITFRSTRVVKAGPGRLKVHGNLSIRGVTKPVVLSVEGPSKPQKDPWGQARISVSATATINRKDFGLTWNKVLEAGGFLVGDEVTLVIDAELKKAAPTPQGVARP